MVVERVRKQQRPERAPGSCEIGRENFGSEEEGAKPMKSGRKPKVLKSKKSESEVGAEETEIEQSKDNGVSQKKENVMNKDGVSEIGKRSREKVKKTGGTGRKKGGLKPIWDFVDEKQKGNGECTEQGREGGVLKGERKVKFDENCQVMGEDTNGLSDEFTSSSRKRKKVNYNEDKVDEDDKGIFGNKRKKRTRGPKVTPKRKILTDEKVQENDASDKKDNEEVNVKKRGQKGKKNEEASESEGLKSERREEDDKVEVNKAKQRGPNRQEKPVKEESTSDLASVEQKKASLQSNDVYPYSLRKRKEQKQECALKGTKKKTNEKVRKFSYLLLYCIL